jgi:hypothetical protein
VDVEVVRKYNPEVDREVAIRQLELIRDLVITESSRTSGIGTFDETRLQKTMDVMRQYQGMNRELPLLDVHAPQLVPKTPVRP